MKKIILKSVLPVVLLALCSVGSFAKGNVFINSYLRTNYAIVSAHYDTDEAFRVKIIDAQGVVLYSSKRIDASNSYQKLFDLTSFEDGAYSLILSGKNSHVVEAFKVKDHKLNKEVKADDLVKTFVHKNENKLIVSNLNFNNKVISMTIVDASGDIVYSSLLPKEITYSGLYDITGLPIGNYNVSINSEGKDYSYAFRKE